MYSPESRSPDLNWTNSFAALPEDFYSRVTPTPFKTTPRMIHFNHAAAKLIGLDKHAAKELALLDMLSARYLPEGSDPVAMLYAGHQFGHFVPQLGDGRAIMLGEVTHATHGKWELQLKGSGLTPYSRDGDGRAVLRSTIREYLCSEAMHGLGIPTTRALAMIGADDEVYREKIETGAMLTRMAPSHVRFGSFEVFFYRNQFAQIQILADYVIEHHYPELKQHADPYLALFGEVMQRTAHLIAQWQSVGFAHGVMNSDNMSILGQTLDYGPFGFMESYQPGYICNHSDHHGRYAFDQQPQIGLFNLSCLAQAMLPLFMDKGDDNPDKAVEKAKTVLDDYQAEYTQAYARLMRAKLGFREAMPEDQQLLQDLLNLMQQNQVDYTILFRALGAFRINDSHNHRLRDLFLDREGFDQWAQRYAERLTRESSGDVERRARMNNINPKYILRNYLAEIAIRKAEDERDYSEIDTLFKILQQPCEEWPEFEDYAGHPPEWAQQIAVSCSS
ncbi:MAG: YdiU family protein [Thioalkalispiraceae bacterium]|jgi:hypothetical protein